MYESVCLRDCECGVGVCCPKAERAVGISDNWVSGVKVVSPNPEDKTRSPPHANQTVDPTATLLRRAARRMENDKACLGAGSCELTLAKL